MKQKQAVRGLEVHCAPFASQEREQLVFKGAMEEVMTDMLRTIRAGVSDQTALVDNIIAAVGSVTKRWKQQEGREVNKNVGFQLQVLLQLQAAVGELRDISDSLCERLFNLNQQLITVEVDKLSAERRKWRALHQKQLEQLKYCFSQEREELKAKIERYQGKCFELEDILARTGVRGEQEESRRRLELVKYVEIIEELALQIQKLKEANQKGSIFYTEGSHEQHGLSHNFSQSFQANSELACRRCPPCQHQQKRKDSFQTASEEYYSRERPSERPSRVVGNQNDCRSIYVPLPNSKEYQNRARQQPPSYQAIVISNKPVRRDELRQTRTTSQERSTVSRQKLGRVYQSRLSSEERINRCEDYRPMRQGYQKIQEKNIRMRAVEQKLQGLKRKLEREVRNMKN